MSKYDKRVSINIEGAEHNSPIPSASRIGPFMMTGHIYGRDANNEVVDDPEEQVRRIFVNLKAILAAADASAENVLKLEFKVRSLALRPTINQEWNKMFPDASSRPARHVEESSNLSGKAAVSCEGFVVIQ